LKTSTIGSTTKACEDSDPFLRHHSARDNFLFQEGNRYRRFNRFSSGDITDSIQGCEFEWLIVSNASCRVICSRSVLSWQCTHSTQASPGMCPSSPVTYFGCELSTHSEHIDKQEIFTHCSPSDLQLGFYRDITKCCKAKYLNNHSKILLCYYYSDTINHEHASKQERNHHMCYKYDCGKNCSRLFIFLNTLAMKMSISCALQHYGSRTTRGSATKVEILTIEFFCSFAFILVDSFETYLYTRYERTEVLCLVNTVSLCRCILIVVKVFHSDGERIRPKHGRTAKQNGVGVFLCLGSNSFNPALAKPS
jgi:hypothetical protein